MTTTDVPTGSMGSSISVLHDEEWCGMATFYWRCGDRKGEFKVPGQIARVLLEGANHPRFDDLRSRLAYLLETFK